jgi:4-amino-4-deoxy-L-arabinose transferase-like glycosyltransferase
MHLALTARAQSDIPLVAARSKTLYRLGLTAVLALSAVLNLNRLSHNGYANIFYTAGVKSMLASWHNFLFVTFDPGGLVTIDKPPLGLWVQALSAKLFGLSPLSLLLPEAIAGVLAVAALYWVMARPFGRPAALAGAVALAVFPSFVAVSRDNNLDALLILQMILACGLALRAIESGHWRALLGCALLIGLAFNTKTLAAYLIVPPIAVAYLLCASGPPLRRVLRLLVAGLTLAIVSLSWIAFVDLTPASQRPYIGSSLNNSEFGLTFEYNGFGRVEGQVGGPGQVPIVRPASSILHRRSRSSLPSARARRPAPHLSPILPDGRLRNPIAFGGATGPLRLFDTDLGDQGGWTLPLAAFGLLTLVLSLLFPNDRLAADGSPETSPDGPRRSPGRTWRRDPELAALIVLGGWFLAEAAVLSLSSGIVHPYYTSALGPGAAAMLGAGAVASVRLSRRRDRPARLIALALLTLGVIATVIVQLLLLSRTDYMHWFAVPLAVGAAIGLFGFLAIRRVAAPALAFTLGLLLLAPTAYAATTWLAPVDGTFPAAGPQQAAGYGGLGVASRTLLTDYALIAYLRIHHPGTRWAVLTQASDTAAPLILLGLDAGALGGYSATDPVLDGRGLARLVTRREARYVLLGGAYATRGGNRASDAVAKTCLRIPGHAWKQTNFTEYSSVLYDCAGHERALARA